MRRVAIALLLFVFGTPLFGQYAETLSVIAESSTITLDEAVWLVGSAAGSLGPTIGPSEAIEALAGLEIPLPSSERAMERPVGNARFAWLLLQVEEVGAGFWYGVLPSRLTAFSFLRREGVFPQSARSTQPITGAAAIDAVRAYLNRAAAEAENR